MPQSLPVRATLTAGFLCTLTVLSYASDANWSPQVLSQLRAAASAPGALLGRVTTPQGDVVPHAIVVVTSKERRQQATANANGQYRLELLPSGVYRLVVQLDGFEPTVLEAVSVLPSVRATRDLTLIPRQLDSSIPEPNPVLKPTTVDPEAWVNPWLTITPDGIELRARSVSSNTEKLPVHRLRGALVDLPHEAWPAGRVVAVSRHLSVDVDDVAAIERHATVILRVLEDLGLSVRQDP